MRRSIERNRGVEMKKISFNKLRSLDSASKEAYVTLRTNIEFSGSDISVIALTSTQPNEGKSVISFHLAKAFAEAGKKVLLLDTDIRKSVLLSRYEVDLEIYGLTHYLCGQQPLEEVVYDTNIDNLCILYSGQVAPNPTELLGGKKFEELIGKLREEYDIIVVDCPPLGSVIDAAVVAKLCDGSLLVVENNAVSYRMVQKVKKQLERSGTRILGCVMNKVDLHSHSYSYRYYNSYDAYDDYNAYDGDRI